MTTTITTAAGLAAHPLGSTYRDSEGDVWMLESHSRGGWLHGPEMGTVPIDHVLKRWGPLTLEWRPDAEPESQRVQPTVAGVCHECGEYCGHPDQVQPSREDLAREIDPDVWDFPEECASDIESALGAADRILALFAAQPTVAEVQKAMLSLAYGSKSPAIRDIVYERATHEQRGWTAEHDAEHGPKHLIALAQSRLALARAVLVACPEDLRSVLVKAGALVVAGIELLDREAEGGAR